MGALMELASPGHCDIHLVHAEEDMLSILRAQTNWSFKQEGSGVCQVVGYSSWALTGVTKQNTEESVAGLLGQRQT